MESDIPKEGTFCLSIGKEPALSALTPSHYLAVVGLQ